MYVCECVRVRTLRLLLTIVKTILTELGHGCWHGHNAIEMECQDQTSHSSWCRHKSAKTIKPFHICSFDFADLPAVIDVCSMHRVSVVVCVWTVYGPFRSAFGEEAWSETSPKSLSQNTEEFLFIHRGQDVLRADLRPVQFTEHDSGEVWRFRLTWRPTG